MANFKLTWDNDGARKYETGVDRGVVYMVNGGKYTKGEAWDGLVKVSESPSGAEPTKLYANNRKYGELTSAEEFGGTIEAYTYPDNFATCDGTAELLPGLRARQQKRKTFGLTYRTLIGNDEEGTAYGYTIHLVYGCRAKPSSREYNTVNDNPDAQTMSWEFSCTPVEVTDNDPTCVLEIDTTMFDEDKITALENVLYGSDSTEARLPLPDEVAAILKGTKSA